MFQRVAIIGMGLIGGSIGLALRKKRAVVEVTGYDPGRGCVTVLAGLVLLINIMTRWRIQFVVLNSSFSQLR